MIFGIGVDIVEVKRFNKWVCDKNLICKYFNNKEIPSEIFCDNEKTIRQINALSQKLAARFACKEAFSKALGTGIIGFNLCDVYVENDENGKPLLKLENSAKEIFENLCKNGKIFVSISHEKEYAISNVIIEI